MGYPPVRPALVVVAVLVTAGLGTAAGFGLHRTFSGASQPHVAARGSPIPPSPTTPPGPSVSSTAGPASPDPTRESSPGDTPSPRPSSTRPPTTQPGPAFTDQALLLPQEFEERGWATARVIQRFDDLPAPAITPCTGTGRGSGLVKAYAAIYASARSTADEVVMRFASTGDAKDAYAGLRADIRTCSSSTRAARQVEIRTRHTAPDAALVSEALWWNTRDPDGGPMRGVLAIARADDRILVLNLESERSGSDPAKTTRIDDLLIQAARRLV